MINKQIAAYLVPLIFTSACIAPIQERLTFRSTGYTPNSSGGSSSGPVVPAAPQPSVSPTPVKFSGPIVISEGGVYSGNWESLDSMVPAVKVTTSQPVFIENSVIRSKGHLIQGPSRANISVKNVQGYGLTPTVADRAMGRFLHAENVLNIRVENCYLEQTSGMYLAGYAGDHSVNQSVRVLNNRAKNIDGRKPNGQWEYVQFIQFNNLNGVRGVEIAQNEIINEPGKSFVEDNINLFMSSGTADSWISIHDNYIQGSWRPDPHATGHTGGGIMLSDGSEATGESVSAYARAFQNQVVGTTHYGIAITTGHDQEIYDNRIIESNLLPDGTRAGSSNVGIYVVNGANNDELNSATFYNVKAYRNVVGYINNLQRSNPFWFRTCHFCPDAGNAQNDPANNNTAIGTVTRQMELDEFIAWQKKVADKKWVVGPTRALVPLPAAKAGR